MSRDERGKKIGGGELSWLSANVRPFCDLLNDDAQRYDYTNVSSVSRCDTEFRVVIWTRDDQHWLDQKENRLCLCARAAEGGCDERHLSRRLQRPVRPDHLLPPHEGWQEQGPRHGIRGGGSHTFRKRRFPSPLIPSSMIQTRTTLKKPWSLRPAKMWGVNLLPSSFPPWAILRRNWGHSRDQVGKMRGCLSRTVRRSFLTTSGTYSSEYSQKDQNWTQNPRSRANTRTGSTNRPRRTSFQRPNRDKIQIDIRWGWCPRTAKGQRLIGMEAVNGNAAVNEFKWLATCQSKI